VDKLAGTLHLHGGQPSLEWDSSCRAHQSGETGAEAVVLGPGATERDEAARALARHPENPASALGALHRRAAGFAFSLWEPGPGRLTLGCDPLGLQSLYCRETGGAVRFGGRLSDTLPAGQRQKLHLASADHFLRYLSVPPGRSLIGGVRRVHPGAMRIYPEPEGRREALFPLEGGSFSGEGKAAERLLEILRASVEEALSDAPDDEPVGLLLSGGIDSTALLALLREARKGPIIAIHAAPPGSPDRDYARRMAERYGAEFADIELSARDAEDSLTWIVSGMEAPSGNASAVANCRAFAEAAERGARRVFSGLGSDELFCGQGKHLIAPWWPWLALLPAPLRASAARLAPGGKKRPLPQAIVANTAAGMHRAMYAFFSEEESASLRGGLARFTETAPLPWLEPEEAGFPSGYGSEILQVDLNVWLRGALTPMAGALAAANGIELHLPFCAPGALNLSASLPLSWKVRGREGKRVLRRALSDIVPEEILGRPRQGFTVPMGEWLRGDLSAFARRLLSPERVERWSIVEPGAIRGMLDAHEAGRRDWGLPIWAWMSFSIWYDRFAAGEGGAAGPER
jgi:asparagine synthase (glutamine-hydrolysing)